MSKEFICKGCGEKFNKDMQSSNVGYCYICNEFYMRKQLADIEAKLAESENKLNQYPYKNDVIEKQYKELKDGIKFRIENNIADDWEQHYHCIDVLCEKHKARIRDIETGICKIEQLEQQLAESEEKINMLEEHKFYADNIIQAYADKCKKYEQQLADKEKEIEEVKEWWACQYKANTERKEQDKISFAVEKLEKVKEKILSYEEIYYQFSENGAKIPVFCVENFRVRQNIDNQITELTHQHEEKGE